MQAISTQKFVKITPRKLRLIADMVRKMSPSEAMETLPFVNRNGVAEVKKTINTAIANARVKGMNEENLKFKTLEINEGPRLKRFRPVSRGMAHGYVRQMSHIRVVLEEKKVEKKKVVKGDKTSS